LEWLYTAEKVFCYNEISKKKKVKCIPCKLRKYIALRLNNLVALRARKRKGKIC